MSIVTLKRKTNVLYNNMSVGSKTGFSLNGTHRNQGYIGQTMLSRSLPRTLMKGNVPKGHGGCCGKYPQYGIIQSAVTSLNDPTVVKASVQNTNGMLRTHYKWIWRPQPYSTTKTDTGHNSNPQSTYIANISANTAKRVDAANILNTPICFKQCMNLPREALPKNNHSSQLVQTRNPGNIVKTNITRPEKNNALLGISSSNTIKPSYTQDQYIRKLSATCTTNLNNVSSEITTNCNSKPLVNTNLNKTPLIGGQRSF
jgi:hypothetical protein